MNRATIFLLIISFTSIYFKVHAQVTMTLEEAVDYAIVRSQTMKLAQADIALADAQIREYKAQGIPQLNAFGNYNYYFAIPTQILPDFLGPSIDGRLLEYNLIDPSQIAPPSEVGIPAQFGTNHNLTVGVEASFMIFDASFFAGLKAIAKAKELAGKQTEQTEFEIKQQVIEAYILVAFTKKNMEFINKNIDNLSKTFRETKALYDNGFVEQLDVDRLELSLQNLELEKEKLQRMVDVSVNLLKFQMNFPVREDLQLTDDMDALLSKIALGETEVSSTYNYIDRPEYNSILAGSELNKLQIESIKSGYYPSLRGVLNYSNMLMRNDLFDPNENPWFPMSFAGVQLSIPIYDGSRRKAQLQQAQLELEKVNIQQNIFEQSMDLEVVNARKNLQNAESALTNRQKNLNLAERIYNTTQIKYNQGVGSSIETTQAERELYTSQAAYTEALYDVLKARFNLKKALGKI
jgi:outer membrane protein